MASCASASEAMTGAEMAALMRAAPPGPWPDGWAGWPNVREAHLLLLAEAESSPPPYPGGEGRGVVMCVNAKPGMSSGKNLPQGYFPGAWCALRELRRHGCRLPVTLAYLGDVEWDDHLTRLVAPLGASVLDLRRLEAADPVLGRRPRILAGWESKAYALLHAPYEEALYLDADNIPLADPSYLFDSKQFRHFGSVFWPDVPPYDREEWLPPVVWENVGLGYRDSVDFETGQFMIHRRRCWRELYTAWHMNEHSDWYYKFVFGDKSTFHLAWSRVGTPWAIPDRGPGGNHASLVQFDFAGRPLFQHLTRNKPSLSGFPSPGALWPRAECEGHLIELRKLWDGRLWYTRPATEEERSDEAPLVGRLFVYHRNGLDSRPMRLLEDNRVGRGLARCEVGWGVRRVGGAPALVLSGLDGSPTALLRPDGHGGWSGAWIDHERCACSLVPSEGD